MLRTALISMFITSTALAETWTVDDDGKADFDNIQAAVDAASDGDEIIVAPGTYTSDGDWVVWIPTKQITLRSSDGPATTILDGESAKRVLVFDSNEANTAIVDGFTITGGGSYNWGGGIDCWWANPTITNCIIENNETTSEGGGIMLYNSNAVIENCIIRNNTSYDGGGIYCFGNSPSFNNCVIESNFSQFGGGVYSWGSAPSFSSCVISENASNNGPNSGSGIYCADNSSLDPTLTDTVVCGNIPAAFQIWGSDDWTDGGGNCVTASCEDNDNDGNPDGCDDTADGVLEVPSEFLTIQAAVDAASDGDEIIVAPGTYTSTGDWVVNLFGKQITLRSSDGPDTTIIDGESARRVLVFQSKETTTTVIEGFTITRGSYYTGGGILCSWASPTITNCIIEENASTSDGGGIHLYASDAIIENCIIRNNTSYDGGGIYFDGMFFNPSLSNCVIEGNSAERGGGIHSSASALTIDNCTFANNIAGNSGGGAYIDYGNPEITNCTFTENDGHYGGGVMILHSSPSITDCIFTSNSCEQIGGALYAGYDSNPILEDCEFVSNTADAAGAVGWNTSSTIKNCVFTNNIATEDGGAVATVSYDPYSSLGWDTWLPKLDGCDFNGNISGIRGGALLVQGHAHLKDCTFTNNETETYSGELDCWEGGAAMFVMFERTVTMENCTSFNNTAPNGGGDGIQVWFNSSLKFIGDNAYEGITYGDCGLENLSLYMEAESVINLEDDLVLPPNGITCFDIDDIATTPSLVVDGELVRDGCLSITNDSGSLMQVQAGDTIQLMQAKSWSSWFSSLIFPLLPDGLGIEFWGNGITVWAKIVEVEQPEFNDPVTAGLEEPPIEIVSFDPDGDDVDDIAMLFGGDVNKLIAYSVSEDDPPEIIEGLDADMLNGSLDVSAADLNNDGLDDLLVVNGSNQIMLVCLTSNANDSLSFDVSYLSIPVGANDTITCVSAIDWDGDSNLDAVVGIDAADLPGPDGQLGTDDDIVNYDKYRILLDVASDTPMAGTWFEVDLFDINPTPAEVLKGDPPTSVAEGNNGFVGGTRYGRVHSGSSQSNVLNVLGELSGHRVCTIKTQDLNNDGGDGLLDIMLTSDEAQSIYLLEGDEEEPNGYSELIPILVSDPVEDLAAFDADRDGDTDLLYTSPQTGSPLTVLRNDGPLELRAQALKGLTWSKQTAGVSVITAGRITSGSLSPKDEEDDWVVGGGSSSAFKGDAMGIMEQTNIRVPLACPSDFNSDGAVDVNDLLILIAAWGSCDACPEDLNSDDIVDVNDLLLAIAAWGSCE